MTKVKTTAVAVINPNSTASVIGALKERLSSLKAITESNWKSSGEVPGICNIRNENKIEKLIEAASSILGRKEHYDRAAKLLGLTTFKAFSIDGASYDDLMSDIRLRIAVITHDEEKKQIEADIAEAESFLKEEDRERMFHEKMAQKYGAKQLK